MPMLKKCNDHRQCKDINTGAAWVERHLEAIGRGDGRCTHCGQGDGDLEHVLWKCKEANKHRKFKDLMKLNPDDLPGYIKYGIPRAMCHKIDCTLRGH